MHLMICSTGIVAEIDMGMDSQDFQSLQKPDDAMFSDSDTAIEEWWYVLYGYDLWHVYRPKTIREL